MVSIKNNNAWQTAFAVAILVTVVAVALTGCAPDITETDFYSLHPDPATPVADIQTLGTNSDGSVEITLLAREDPHVGYNVLLVRASRQAVPITKATVQVVPRTGSLTAPLVSPALVEADVDGYLGVGAHFLQPKGTSQSWTVDVIVEDSGTTATVSFELSVVDSVWMQELPGSDDSDRVFVSWIRPQRPTTGNAPFEIAIHRQTTTGFAPVEDAAVDLYPYMDMGAGEGHSTPFVAPAHTDGASYVGRVNYIMSGGWDMTVRVRLASEPERSAVFAGFTVY